VPVAVVACSACGDNPKQDFSALEHYGGVGTNRVAYMLAVLVTSARAAGLNVKRYLSGTAK
jgi:hypothetical protein